MRSYLMLDDTSAVPRLPIPFPIPFITHVCMIIGDDALYNVCNKSLTLDVIRFVFFSLSLSLSLLGRSVSLWVVNIIAVVLSVTVCQSAGDRSIVCSFVFLRLHCLFVCRSIWLI